MMQRFTTAIQTAKARADLALLEDALGATALIVMLVGALHLPVLV